MFAIPNFFFVGNPLSKLVFRNFDVVFVLIAQFTWVPCFLTGTYIKKNFDPTIPINCGSFFRCGLPFSRCYSDNYFQMKMMYFALLKLS